MAAQHSNDVRKWYDNTMHIVSQDKELSKEIGAVRDRYIKIANRLVSPKDVPCSTGVFESIALYHLNVCTIDLYALSGADDREIIRDVSGIVAYVAGKNADFVSSFAIKEEVTA